MPNLTDRQSLILKAVIQEFISTASTVSSKLIGDSYLRNASGATIRNEMVALEGLGYLKQPHISAGRIPTDKGYRFFVDSLMERVSLDDIDKQKIKNLIGTCHKEIDGLLTEASSLLSKITKYTSVILFPFANEIRLKRLNLVKLSKNIVLIVVIDSGGNVWKQEFETEGELSRENLIRIENLINVKFAGKRLIEIADESKWENLGREIAPVSIINVLLSLKDMFRPLDNIKVFIQGTSLFLEQPEFSKLAKTREVFETLDEKSRLMEFFNDIGEADEIIIRIGPEVAKISEECSFVGAPYSIDGARAGTLGLFGPCRMNYAMAVSAVEYLASNLSMNFGKIF